MGPIKTNIGWEDVRLGIRYAWHEQPDTWIINAYMILALGVLTPFVDSTALLVLTLTLLGAYVFHTGHLLYRGLAAARDARDFGTYIESGRFSDVALLDPWFSLPADHDDTPVTKRDYDGL
jgi:hypothetical protein